MYVYIYSSAKITKRVWQLQRSQTPCAFNTFTRLRECHQIVFHFCSLIWAVQPWRGCIPARNMRKFDPIRHPAMSNISFDVILIFTGFVLFCFVVLSLCKLQRFGSTWCPSQNSVGSNCCIKACRRQETKRSSRSTGDALLKKVWEACHTFYIHWCIFIHAWS